MRFIRCKLTILIILSIYLYSTGKTITQIGIKGGLGQSFELHYQKQNYNRISFSSGLFLTWLDFNYFDLQTNIEYCQKESNKLNRSFSKWGRCIKFRNS